MLLVLFPKRTSNMDLQTKKKNKGKLKTYRVIWAIFEAFVPNQWKTE